MSLFELIPRQVNPDTEWIARKAMIDNTTCATQNCYVNPWGTLPFTGPPPITITTTDSTNPTQDLEPPRVDTGYTVHYPLSEQDKADLEAMIRRVIKEEVASVVRDVLSDRDEAERRERWCDEW